MLARSNLLPASHPNQQQIGHRTRYEASFTLNLHRARAVRGFGAIQMTQEFRTSFACATMSGCSRRESPITAESKGNASDTAHRNTLEGRFRLNGQPRFLAIASVWQRKSASTELFLRRWEKSNTTARCINQ